MIALSGLRRFSEFVLKGEGVFGIVVFEAVFEVIDDVNEGMVLAGLHVVF